MIVSSEFRPRAFPCPAHALYREWCENCRKYDLRLQQREADTWYAAEVARMAERAPA